MYPQEQFVLGNYLKLTRQNVESESWAKSLLLDWYKEIKAKYENLDPKYSCEFTSPKYIINKPNLSDPLCQLKTVAIKFFAYGRAFVIHRNFRKCKSFKIRHKNKKNVPKKKRGKYVLSGYSKSGSG